MGCNSSKNAGQPKTAGAGGKPGDKPKNKADKLVAMQKAA